MFDFSEKHINKQTNDSCREGTLGCLLHLYPEFHNNVFLFVGLTILGTLVNFICWFVELSVQKFQPLILIYKRGKFVYYN